MYPQSPLLPLPVCTPTFLHVTPVPSSVSISWLYLFLTLL